MRTRAGLRLGLRLAVIALAGAAIGLAVPGAALAQQGQVNLALLPVGQTESFFDLTMVPGQTRSLAVDIANNGAAEVSARTYAADVYTIINGGFGARLRGAAQSGMTAWLTYPTRVWDLAASQVVRRTFEVRVPSNAAPGGYITSLVLENDQPIGVQGAVDINQFIRQAVAVVVTVPGPRAPALTIGDASIAVVGGQSVVSVAVANTGNIRLSPEVGFALLDESGKPVGQSTFQMGTFYALTSTFIEVPMASLLPPGAYVARVTLSDATEDLRVDREVPAGLVDGAAPPSPENGQAVGQVIGIPGSAPASPPLWAGLLAAAALFTVGTLIVIAIRHPGRHAGAPRAG